MTSIRSRIRDAFRRRDALRYAPGSSVLPASNLNIPMPKGVQRPKDWKSPFARGERLHFAAGSYDPEAIPKLTLDREPWRLLQEIGIAYEFALGALLTSTQNGDYEQGRLYVPRIMKVVQQATHHDPQGRYVLKLFTETCYCHMTKEERVLLGIEDGD